MFDQHENSYTHIIVVSTALSALSPDSLVYAKLEIIDSHSQDLNIKSQKETLLHRRIGGRPHLDGALVEAAMPTNIRLSLMAKLFLQRAIILNSGLLSCQYTTML